MAMAATTGKRLTQNGKSMDDLLGDDLLLEILHRLPYKDLGRCILVSKRWGNLLFSPNFLFKFNQRQRPLRFSCFLSHQNALVVPEYSSLSDALDLYTLPFVGWTPNSDTFDFRIMNHSNGGLLLHHLDENLLYVCFLATKHYVKIAPLPRDSLTEATVAGFICDDPRNYSAGGDDTLTLKHSRNRGFRVVAIHEEICTDLRISIYSSLNNEWKSTYVAEDQITVRIPRFHPYAVAHNGKMYFPGKKNIFIILDPFTNRNPTYKTIPYPIGYVIEKGFPSTLGSISDQILRMGQFTTNEHVLRVWELLGSGHDIVINKKKRKDDDDDRTWKLLHKIYMLDHIPKDYYPLQCIFHSYNRDIVYLLRSSHDRHNMPFFHVYNLKNERLEGSERINNNKHAFTNLKCPRLYFLKSPIDLHSWPPPIPSKSQRYSVPEMKLLRRGRYPCDKRPEEHP